MDTQTNNSTTTTRCEQFPNLSELLAVTDIRKGNYVLPLYGGNIFIHQKPSADSNDDNNAKITAYQTDNHGALHFIAVVHTSQIISQLSVSADGRYFGFIAIDDGITTGYVYFLDVLAREMEVAHSWSYTYCPNPKLFFSPNSQFAIFSPGANKLQVQSLYSDDPEVVFVAPTDNSNTINQMAANPISVALGNDYLVWIQSTGSISVIDLVADQQPTEWAATNIQLNTNFTSCTFYNNYLVHIYHKDEKSPATISLLQINPITRVVLVSSQFEFPELGATCSIPSLDGKSITLHNYYKHLETRMSVLLPEIATRFVS